MGPMEVAVSPEKPLGVHPSVLFAGNGERAWCGGFVTEPGVYAHIVFFTGAGCPEGAAKAMQPVY